MTDQSTRWQDKTTVCSRPPMSADVPDLSSQLKGY